VHGHGIPAGETTRDGEMSFETVNCVGACALGPLVTVDEEYYGNMNVTKMNELIAKLRGQPVKAEVQEEAA
jgi:NADH:ubiquinone oxidoreductase subunit E